MTFGAIYPAVGNAVPYLFLNHGRPFARSLLASHVPNYELDATREVPVRDATNWAKNVFEAKAMP